jgi:predicted metal-binding protein
MESFTVEFSDYKVPNPGYCKPAINNKDFASGKYDSYCWDKMGDEDCGLLNRNGYNCGKDLKTGKNMECIYTTGTCRDDPGCFSTCYDRVGKFNEPYMIPVEYDNLIGLGALN